MAPMRAGAAANRSSATSATNAATVFTPSAIDHVHPRGFSHLLVRHVERHGLLLTSGAASPPPRNLVVFRRRTAVCGEDRDWFHRISRWR